jgi:hypothetical protein
MRHSRVQINFAHSIARSSPGRYRGQFERCNGGGCPTKLNIERIGRPPVLPVMAAKWPAVGLASAPSGLALCRAPLHRPWPPRTGKSARIR